MPGVRTRHLSHEDQVPGSRSPDGCQAQRPPAPPRRESPPRRPFRDLGSVSDTGLVHTSGPRSRDPPRLAVLVGSVRPGTYLPLVPSGAMPAMSGLHRWPQPSGTACRPLGAPARTRPRPAAQPHGAGAGGRRSRPRAWDRRGTHPGCPLGRGSALFSREGTRKVSRSATLLVSHPPGCLRLHSALGTSGGPVLSPRVSRRHREEAGRGRGSDPEVLAARLWAPDHRTRRGIRYNRAMHDPEPAPTFLPLPRVRSGSGRTVCLREHGSSPRVPSLEPPKPHGRRPSARRHAGVVTGTVLIARRATGIDVARAVGSGRGTDNITGELSRGDTAPRCRKPDGQREGVHPAPHQRGQARRGRAPSVREARDQAPVRRIPVAGVRQPRVPSDRRAETPRCCVAGRASLGRVGVRARPRVDPGKPARGVPCR